MKHTPETYLRQLDILAQQMTVECAPFIVAGVRDQPDCWVVVGRVAGTREQLIEMICSAIQSAAYGMNVPTGPLVRDIEKAMR
jgi:hypothetical protein